MFKITKNKSYRLNFILDGSCYSLNEYCDGYERCVGLIRKDKEFSCVVKYDVSLYSVLKPFIKRHKLDATYAQQYDLVKLEDFLRNIIYGRG